jgi:hypothetical protein
MTIPLKKLKIGLAVSFSWDLKDPQEKLNAVSATN